MHASPTPQRPTLPRTPLATHSRATHYMLKLGFAIWRIKSIPCNIYFLFSNQPRDFGPCSIPADQPPHAANAQPGRNLGPARLEQLTCGQCMQNFVVHARCLLLRCSGQFSLSRSAADTRRLVLIGELEAADGGAASFLGVLFL